MRVHIFDFSAAQVNQRNKERLEAVLTSNPARTVHSG